MSNKDNVETEKVNTFLRNIPTDNFTKLNELYYAGVILLCNKININQRNLNKNTKPGWKIRLEVSLMKM